MANKEPNIQASSSITIDASAEKIWEVLAVQFGDVGKWASGVDASEGSGELIDGNTCSERACKISATGFSDTKERITVYDKDSHMLRYTLFRGLPGFVKNAFNTWILEPQDDTVTLVKAYTQMQATGIMGVLMGGFMRKSTKKVLIGMCEELKFYVENGNPHPNKLKAIEKYKRNRSLKIYK